VEAELVVEETVLQGLDGIQAGDRLFVLCWFHMADRKTLRVHPRGNSAIPKRGVFATRSPDRPNPIGLCLVDVLAVEGPVLKVRGLDAVDGTPVVDLKPYVSALNS
jgi:tRNA-Thr(GGU) m(6)t(6)A37 methyltransferase TsaA